MDVFLGIMQMVAMYAAFAFIVYVGLPFFRNLLENMAASKHKEILEMLLNLVSQFVDSQYQVSVRHLKSDKSLSSEDRKKQLEGVKVDTIKLVTDALPAFAKRALEVYLKGNPLAGFIGDMIEGTIAAKKAEFRKHQQNKEVKNA